jgi:DNA polymerase III alpha subunit
VFTCALLNSQPMGFYAPAQIVRDAREHGVEVLPPILTVALSLSKGASKIGNNLEACFDRLSTTVL